MYPYHQMAHEARYKRDAFQKYVENERLVRLARRGARRFWWFSWRLPVMRLFNFKPAPRRESTPVTISDNL